MPPLLLLLLFGIDCNLPLPIQIFFSSTLLCSVRSFVFIAVRVYLVCWWIINVNYRFAVCDVDDWSTTCTQWICAVRRYKFNQFCISWLSLWLFGIWLSPALCSLSIQCNFFVFFMCLHYKMCLFVRKHRGIMFISSTHFKCLVSLIFYRKHNNNIATLCTARKTCTHFGVDINYYQCFAYCWQFNDNMSCLLFFVAISYFHWRKNQTELIVASHGHLG